MVLHPTFAGNVRRGRVLAAERPPAPLEGIRPTVAYRFFVEDPIGLDAALIFVADLPKQPGEHTEESPATIPVTTASMQRRATRPGPAHAESLCDEVFPVHPSGLAS
jgi:hypothetical protein